MHVRGLSGAVTEEYEVRHRREHLELAVCAETGRDLLALARHERDALGDVRRRGELRRDRLRERAHVVGEPDRVEDVDELRMRDEDAHAQTRGRVHLRERLRHDEVRPRREARQHADAGELPIGLVNENERLRRRLRRGEDGVLGHDVPGRVVRPAEAHHVGAVPRDGVAHAPRVDLVRESHALGGDGHAEDLTEPRVHRVRRREEEDGPSGAAEDEEGLEEYLVRAVAEDELLRRDVPLRREEPAELRRARVRIAIEEDRVELGRAEITPDGIRLGPFVGLEPHVGRLLLRAIGAECAELGTRLRQSFVRHQPLSSIDAA